MEKKQKFLYEDKMTEIYAKHIGINAEMQYKPTQKEWVMDAMQEYGTWYAKKTKEDKHA